MHNYDYDLFVIGAGSGGVRAARVAAEKGIKVAIAEQTYLGGTCVNVGCVPKKLYSYAAQFRESFTDSCGFGWEAQIPAFNWSTLRDNKSKEIERLNSIYLKLLTNAGVDLYHSKAHFIDPHTLKVGDTIVSAEKILIATGGWPNIPDIPGSEHILSSNEIFDLAQLPERVLIVGGGYIAVEFASIFNGLGSHTTLSYRGDLPLRGFDNDIRRFATREMEKKGLNIRLNSNVTDIRSKSDNSNIGNSYTVTFCDGSCLEADAVLYATGRIPNTDQLELDKAGVKTSNKAIDVDDRFQTSAPEIYAIGDVINRIQLTPVAINEAMLLINNLYNPGGSDTRPDYSNIATAVFCLPNIATVGLSEEQAKAQQLNLTLYKSEFRSLKNTLSGNNERTLMKLVVDKYSDQVLGAHMVGPEAGEIIQGIAVAIKLGITKAQLDSVIGIHPTSAEEFVTMRTPC